VAASLELEHTDLSGGRYPPPGFFG